MLRWKQVRHIAFFYLHLNVVRFPQNSQLVFQNSNNTTYVNDANMWLQGRGYSYTLKSTMPFIGLWVFKCLSLCVANSVWV